MHVVSSGPLSPHVLVLPGFNLNAAFYAPLAEGLNAHSVGATCVTLPGFHREPPLAEPSWAALVDVVAAHLAAHPATVVAGHSLGGVLALLLAARNAPTIGGLALLEPALFPSRLVATIGARIYQRRVLHPASPRFDNFNGGMRRVADVGNYPRSAIDTYLDCAGTADPATGAALFTTLPDLYPLPFEAVRIPTLLVTGAASGTLARYIASSLRRRMPLVDHVRVAGAAHWLMHENTATTVEALAAFATRCAQAADARPAVRVDPAARGSALQ